MVDFNKRLKENMATTSRSRVVPPSAPEAVNFGDLSLYSSGAIVPEGNYIISYKIQMHDGFGTEKGPLRLGVMADFIPLDDVSAKPKQLFYSMGTNADKSFAPNPDTGKGLVVIPNGTPFHWNDSTNWAIHLKSLYDSGLPPGVFTNDLTVIDGVWAHVVQIDPPDSRKNMQSNTAEVATAVNRPPGKITVVSEVLDGGAPWEGGGGVPKTGKVVAKAAVKPGPVPVVAAAPAPVATNDEDIVTAALTGLSTVFEKNPDGMMKIKVNTDTYAAVKDKFGEQMASDVTTFLKDGDNLATLLGELGYKVAGIKVVPA